MGKQEWWREGDAWWNASIHFMFRAYGTLLALVVVTLD
jgi:hypothetical protein